MHVSACRLASLRPISTIAPSPLSTSNPCTRHRDIHSSKRFWWAAHAKSSYLDEWRTSSPQAFSLGQTTFNQPTVSADYSEKKSTYCPAYTWTFLLQSSLNAASQTSSASSIDMPSCLVNNATPYDDSPAWMTARPHFPNSFFLESLAHGPSGSFFTTTRTSVKPASIRYGSSLCTISSIPAAAAACRRFFVYLSRRPPNGGVSRVARR